MKTKEQIKERLNALIMAEDKSYNTRDLDRINAGIRTLKWVLK